MEEILASIRKIIADDDPSKAGGTDVLELTQMVQEDGSVVDVKAAEPPPPPPQAAATCVAAAPARASKGGYAAPAAATTRLLAPTTASACGPIRWYPNRLPAATASALSSLANTVEIERLASMPQMTSTFIGNGARTLEEMAVGLMKPLLSRNTWLDQNLPPIVDRQNGA